MIETGLGYDFENDCLGHMMNLGIWDAKKAVRVALQAAASCAMTFLKVDCAIAEHQGTEDLVGRIKEMFLNGGR